MILKACSVAAACAVALGAAASFSASAAQPPVAGIAGEAPSTVAGCPYINWRLANHTDGRITGRFWYSDLSGTSVAVGKMDPTGKIHLQLTSAIGDGPVGVLNGQKTVKGTDADRSKGPDADLAKGTVVADLVGPGCANFHAVELPPVHDVGSLDTP